ncbi:hypothetical protein SNE40_021710 [Patella caerulea]|uniref:Uncharacterized protein n=1 Tax=Patella caerulea TaxID=87958 RepID=A0AAN8IZB7_PATCE
MASKWKTLSASFQPQESKFGNLVCQPVATKDKPCKNVLNNNLSKTTSRPPEKILSKSSKTAQPKMPAPKHGSQSSERKLDSEIEKNLAAFSSKTKPGMLNRNLIIPNKSPGTKGKEKTSEPGNRDALKAKTKNHAGYLTTSLSTMAVTPTRSKSDTFQPRSPKSENACQTFKTRGNNKRHVNFNSNSLSANHIPQLQSATSTLSEKGAKIEFLSGNSAELTRSLNRRAAQSCQLKRSATKQVVYYQNRFMVLESISLPSSLHQKLKAGSIHSGSLQLAPDVIQASIKQDVDRKRSNQSGKRLDIDSEEQALAADVNTRCSGSDKKRVASVQADDNLVPNEERIDDCATCATTNTCATNMEMDASSVTMDARAIEIVITDEADNSRRVNGAKQASIWKRIGRVLIDNRMKGKPDCERVLRGHPEENIVLKRILNIIFIIIGVCLLVAVFIVIIYTAIGK